LLDGAVVVVAVDQLLVGQEAGRSEGARDDQGDIVVGVGDDVVHGVVHAGLGDGRQRLVSHSGDRPQDLFAAGDLVFPGDQQVLAAQARGREGGKEDLFVAITHTLDPVIVGGEPVSEGDEGVGRGEGGAVGIDQVRGQGDDVAFAWFERGHGPQDQRPAAIVVKVPVGLVHLDKQGDARPVGDAHQGHGAVAGQAGLFITGTVQQGVIDVAPQVDQHRTDWRDAIEAVEDGGVDGQLTIGAVEHLQAVVQAQAGLAGAVVDHGGQIWPGRQAVVCHGEGAAVGVEVEVPGCRSGRPSRPSRPGWPGRGGRAGVVARSLAAAGAQAQHRREEDEGSEGAGELAGERGGEQTHRHLGAGPHDSPSEGRLAALSLHHGARIHHH